MHVGRKLLCCGNTTSLYEEHEKEEKKKQRQTDPGKETPTEKTQTDFQLYFIIEHTETFTFQLFKNPTSKITKKLVVL